MHGRSINFLFLSKLLFAAMALVALVALAVSRLVPGISPGDLVLYCAAGVGGLLALLVLAVACSLQFSQFILRIGGTDAQWFWFSSEPKGLAALRKGKRIETAGE